MAASLADWEAFFSLAESNSAQVLASRRIRELGLTNLIPESHRALAEEWEAKAARIREAGEKRAEWMGKLLLEANQAGVEVILLKGGILGPALYGDSAYKKMNDIDILVRPEHAEAMVECLRRAGFNSVGGLLGKKEIDSSSHHSPPFVSPDLKCVIGLHWGLCSPYSVWKPDVRGIWKRCAEVTAYGQRAFRMSWEDNMLHLCIHLPFYKTGVRELADVFNITVSGEVDWVKFEILAKRWRAQDAAYRVLRLAGALRPAGVPDDLIAKLKRRALLFTQEDTEKRAALGASLIRFRSVHIGKIEKAFSVFRLSRCYTERVGAWAKTWELTFWPKDEELKRLFALERFESPWRLWWVRLQAPMRCWGALARDYGDLAVVLITLLNIATVLKETARRLFVKDGEPIRFHPAAALLESLE
jgi:hypothetical protein